MGEKFFTFCAMTATLFAISSAASSSISCIYVDGKQKCAQQDDPDGNMAGAAAGIAGGSGIAGAGAGTQDNFNTDYQQIGYGGSYAGNPNYLPAPGYGGSYAGNPNNLPAAGYGGSYGTNAGNPNYLPAPGSGAINGAAVSVGTGAGFPFNPFVPFNGNPYEYVRDFFRGKR